MITQMKEGPRLMDFPKIIDERGNLSFLQYPNQLPFKIKRVFWTYEVPSGEIRGGHAYEQQEEIIIALSGSFDVCISNREGTITKYHMNAPNIGLYLPRRTWRHIENFSTNSCVLHLSSMKFDETDYIRDFNKI